MMMMMTTMLMMILMTTMMKMIMMIMMIMMMMMMMMMLMMIPQVATIRDGIVKGRVWDDVATRQLATVFREADSKNEDLRRLADMYSGDWAEEVEGAAKCGK
jgi:hypothetical protein